MKLLILTQYYPPETGAPQNRLHELASRLQKLGIEITVLTAMPNYPQMKIHEAYKGKWHCKEEIDGLTVYRSSIFVSTNKAIPIRLLTYFSFVFSSLWTGLFRLKKFDFILCESPPLFLGITAFLLCKAKKAKLIFNVSDLWPESAEKLGLVRNRFFLKLSTWLEEFMYRKAALITGQTQGIVDNIRNRFPKKTVYWLPNGADIALFNPQSISSDWRMEQGFKKTDLLFIYAGIIGYAQGLEIILEVARDHKNNNEIKFILLGNGPEKPRLMQIADALKLENVIFIDAVPKPELPAILFAADAVIVPLKRLELFKGAIPSKIFEALAMEKPVLLGVEGEAEELFIKRAQAGISFIPENAADLSEKIRWLLNNRKEISKMGRRGRTFVQDFFSREKIAKDFYKMIS